MYVSQQIELWYSPNVCFMIMHRQCKHLKACKNTFYICCCLGKISVPQRPYICCLTRLNSNAEVSQYLGKYN